MKVLNNDKVRSIAFKEEPKFLSIILRDIDCLRETIASGIKSGSSGHFWNANCSLLYSIVHNYYQKYGGLLTRSAMDSVMDKISTVDSKSLTPEEKASARLHWDDVYSNDVPISDFKLLLEGLNNRYVQWQTLKIVNSKASDLTKSTNNQAEIVKELKNLLNGVEGLYNDPYSLTVSCSDGIKQSLAHIIEKRDNANMSDGVLCGIKALDDIYCGFDVGTYNLLMGMINGGKTTMMFNFAYNMAKAGHYVIYVSLEKKALSFFERLMCLHGLIDYNRIRRGGSGEKGINKETFKALEIVAEEMDGIMGQNLICIQMTQGVKLSKILAEVDRVKCDILNKDKEFRKLGKKLVFFLDYLGAVGNETTTPGRPDLDDHKTSQRVMAYGRENNFVTFTATQLKATASKDIRTKVKKATVDDPSSVEITADDGSGSKMILADADTAIGVALNSEVPPNKMFAHTTKARDAESRRTVVLDFDGKLGRICDQIMEAGQVSGLDDILYNKDLTEEKLRSEDGLFDEKILNAKLEDINAESNKQKVSEIIREEPKRNKEKSLAKEKTYDNDDLFDDQPKKEEIFSNKEQDKSTEDKDLFE